MRRDSGARFTWYSFPGLAAFARGFAVAALRRLSGRARRLHHTPIVESAAPVLVVDDEPAIRVLVAKILERAGLRVDTASDGAEAIAMLGRRSYAVLVLDLNMPNMNGIDVIEHVKQSRDRRPAIIVISASDSVILRQLDGSVVHSIVRKPFDIDVLGDLVTAAARMNASGAAGASGEVLRFPSAS